MSGIAAIIHWNHSPIEDSSIERMLDRIPHRATEGHLTAYGPQCAFGFARRAAAASERGELQPLHDPRLDLWVVADARLDNREELAEILLGGKHPEISDPHLLLAGYARWGAELARHLVGDFAFVIWDAPHREVYAARDPFGVRPLHYHVTSTQVIFASEVEQILTLDEIDRGVDDHAILQYLYCTHRAHQKTFFRAVARITPGHYLRGRKGGVEETRYWIPPREELRFQRTEEYQEEFRRLFQLAVAARLDTDRPIVAQLSGGLDSSSIVCMADRIYREAGSGRPPLRLASAVYPGWDADESPYIHAVAQAVQFPAEQYDGTTWDAADEEVFHIAHPWREARPGISNGWRRIALRDDARVVLAGVGGDELLFEDGVFRDLAARGHWRTLLRETALASHFNYARRTQLTWLRDALSTGRSLPSPPRFLRQLYRRVRPRPPVLPPAWLGPRLRATWEEPWPEDTPPVNCLSHTQEYTWMMLTSPLLCGDIDLLGYLASRRGLQLSYPLLDSRLVSFVLSVPFQHRLPAGWTKCLLRQALGDVLPPQIAQRRSKAVFQTPVRTAVQQNISRHAFVLRDGRWESAPYVEHSYARELVARLCGDEADAGWALWHKAWDILMLEQWLRDLKGVRWPANGTGLRCGHLQVSSSDHETTASVA